MNVALQRLFVASQPPDQAFRIEIARVRERPIKMNGRDDPVAILGAQQSAQRCQMSGGNHAPGNRFAMKEAHVLRFRFDGMSDRVSEVEDAPQSALALVGGNDFGLDADGPGDQLIHYCRRHRQHLPGTLGHEIEYCPIADDAAFQHLKKSGPELTFRKCRGQVGIDQHGKRLVETSNQVLAGYQVHARFPPYRRIHLREQSRGNLQNRNAAHENRGEETRYIGHNPATETDHDTSAVSVALEHLLGKLLHGRKPLVLFAAGKKQNFRRAPV